MTAVFASFVVVFPRGCTKHTQHLGALCRWSFFFVAYSFGCRCFLVDSGTTSLELSTVPTRPYLLGACTMFSKQFLFLVSILTRACWVWRIGEKQIGLGIHGEAGIKQTGLQTADELTDAMISAIVDAESEGEREYAPRFLRSSRSARPVIVTASPLGATECWRRLLRGKGTTVPKFGARKQPST